MTRSRPVSRGARPFTGSTPKLFARHRGATEQQIADSFERLTYTTDLSTAVSEADLISESVPESMAIKESFWRDAVPARSRRYRRSPPTPPP